MSARVLLSLVVILGFAPAEVARADEAPPSLQGVWASRQVTTALVKLPVVGELESKTIAITLMRVEQSGTHLQIKERVCSLDTESPGPVETVYSRAFLKAVSGLEKRAELVARNGGYDYEEPERVRILGARLERPATDPLPPSREDTRVIDADEDGQPGLSVRIKGLVSGDVYVVQRDVSRMVGRVSSKDEVSGLIEWKNEQVILGASTSVLESGPNSRPHPDASRSHFVMRRVPRKASCAQVLERAKLLFGPGD